MAVVPRLGARKTMKIAIATYQGYDGAGVLHAHEFANQMIDLGHEVLLLLCGSLETASVLAEEPRYLVREVVFESGALEESVVDLIERFEPEIIHLWTPRHLPARVGLEAWSRSEARLVIHYEDDEEYILSEVSSNRQFGADDLKLYRFLRQSAYDAVGLERHAASLNLEFLRETVTDPYSWRWIHPLVTPVVEKIASGYTSISPAYGRLIAERSSSPVRTLYPGVDLQRFGRPANELSLRQDLGLEGRTVLLYSGSIAAFHDFTSFLHGLPNVIRDYPDISVVQIGHNYIPHVTGPLLESLGISDHVVFAGPVPHSRMPEYLNLADLFLGVAASNLFNAHRLPSKIPEYMAVGRPIVLADVGVANELDDVAEVIKLEGNSPAEIEKGLRRALRLRPSWPAMGQRLRKKARRIFDWERNAKHLVSFYQELLEAEDTISSEGFDPNIVVTRPAVPSATTSGRRAPTRAKRPAAERTVLVVTEGRIGRSMSGIGIRYLEIARSLGREFGVTLAHPGPSEVSVPGVRQIRWSLEDTRELLAEAAGAEVVIVHSYLLEKLPHLGEVESLLIVDLYCPFIFENIEIHRDRGLPLRDREAIHENDLRVLNDQLLKGDYFLAATEGQRDWILGALTALGRLRPATCPPGTTPESFVGLVPFGLSDDIAAERADEAPVMRGVWPGIEADDIILLWGGGIWSWLDPVTPVRAMERVARVRSDIKLVFLSTRTAEQVIEMPILRELLSLVDQNQELQRSVIFNTEHFIGYEQRAAYFTESDIGVCAHQNTLESHFAFRTRALDYINFALPILTSEGDYFGRFVEENALGRALPVGDVTGWANAILDLAERQARTEIRHRMIEKRESFQWRLATEDLVRIVKKGRKKPNLARFRRTVRAPELSNNTLEVGLAELSLDRLFDLALGRLGRLAPDPSGTLSADHRRLLLHARHLEAELEYLRGHAARLEQKVDLVKRIPLAGRIWRALANKRSNT